MRRVLVHGQLKHWEQVDMTAPVQWGCTSDINHHNSTLSSKLRQAQMRGLRATIAAASAAGRCDTHDHLYRL